MQWRREEYLELMTFGQAPRPMFVELFGPLVGLEEEWREQGASEDEIRMVAFDFDHLPVVQCGANLGVHGAPQAQVLEETDRLRIERDGLGRTLKLDKRTATVPLPLDFPVKNMDDWLKLKPLFTFCEDRIDWTEVERARQQQADGSLVIASIPGGFDVARELMGEVVACCGYYDQPELMRDLLDTLTDTVVCTLNRISQKLAIDQLSMHEDFAGKSGPLIGPALFERFVASYYRKAWDAARAGGARIFDVDSDGDVNPILDALIETGVNSMHPFEPAAGMDSVAVRGRYGKRLAIRGGIDKFAVARGSKDDVRRELEYKLRPEMVASGGIAFGLDHRIPNGTPLENYRYYVDTARELLGLPPRDPARGGWGRMAF